MTKKQALKAILTQSGKHLGDLVCANLAGLQERAKVDAAAKKNGLADDLAIRQTEANNAYRRAIYSAVATGQIDTRAYEVLLLEDSAEKIVHAVVKRGVEDVGDAGLSKNNADIKPLYKIGFDKKAYNKDSKPVEEMIQIEANGQDHPVAISIRRLYLDFLNVYNTDDVRAAFQTAFRKWGGSRMTDGGGVWWIPPVNAEKVRSWSAFIKEIYGQNSAMVIPQYDAQETIESLRTASANDLEGRLAKIEEDLEIFAKSANPREKSYEDRLSQFAELRDIADLHDELLGMRRDALRKKINKAEKSVLGSLDDLRTRKDKEAKAKAEAKASAKKK